MPIKVLEKEVWSKVQAGEVIIGPYSVVRELIDNSIDANSKNIIISIEKGGKQTISVKDDGDGITLFDSKLLFMNHATSKISDFEDLKHLYSMGFRGEALYSICSVSYITLQSRNAADDLGFEVIANGSKRILEKNLSIPKGTSVTVQKLFFNTPPRLSFLGSDRKEYERIRTIIVEKALANPEVSFTFLNEGKKVFEYSKKENFEDRINEVYPNIDIKNLIHIDIKAIEEDYPALLENYKIEDFLILCSSRNYCSSFKPIYHFIFNDRATVSETLQRRVKGFYSSYLPKGFYPYLFFKIRLSPEFIDFNVHPSKETIKIVKEEEFSKIILDIIYKKLSKESFSIDLPDFISLNKDNITYQREENSLYSQNLQCNNSIDKTDFLSSGIYSNSNIYEANADIIHEASSGIKDELGKDNKIENLSFYQNPFDFIKYGNISGVLFKTYILVEYNDLLMVVDQHAADERITFNTLIKFYNKKKRGLLFPKIVEIKEIQDKTILDLFEKIGIEIEQTSKQYYQILTIPDIIPEQQESLFIDGLISFITERAAEKTFLDIENSQIEKFVESFYSHIVARNACHLAIKSGDILGLLDIKRLLERLFAEKNYSSCPHGRPTYYIIKKEDFERSFLRKK